MIKKLTNLFIGSLFIFGITMAVIRDKKYLDMLHIRTMAEAEKIKNTRTYKEAEEHVNRIKNKNIDSLQLWAQLLDEAKNEREKNIKMDPDRKTLYKNMNSLIDKNNY